MKLGDDMDKILKVLLIYHVSLLFHTDLSTYIIFSPYLSCIFIIYLSVIFILWTYDNLWAFMYNIAHAWLYNSTVKVAKIKIISIIFFLKKKKGM